MRSKLRFYGGQGVAEGLKPPPARCADCNERVFFVRQALARCASEPFCEPETVSLQPHCPTVRLTALQEASEFIQAISVLRELCGNVGLLSTEGFEARERYVDSR